MLKRAEEKDAERLFGALGACPELSVRLCALINAYGFDRRFFTVWIQDDFGAVLFRLEGVFSFIDLGGADYEEAAFFLSFDPYFRRLLGEYGAVSRLAAMLGAPCAPESMCVMRMKSAPPAAAGTPASAKLPPGARLLREPMLRTVYSLVSGILPPGSSYDAWYADLSHRIRHGCARAYLIELSGVPVCACLLSAVSGSAALISGLCTAEPFRGRGLATAMLESICQDMLACGLTPVLECTGALEGFYISAGFEKTALIGEYVK